MSNSSARLAGIREWVEARRKESHHGSCPSPVARTPRDSASESCLTTTGLRGSDVTADTVTGGFGVGVQLGKYVLTDLVGRGATALVFRGVHRTLKKPVAIKVLRLGCDDDSQTYAARLQQLRREAELLAQLSHPNVVRVLDFDDADDQPYLVMECVDGMALSEVLHHCGRLRADRAARVVRHVAQGLAAAHQLGIVHRDVKPGNILLGRDGSVKLADLGLAMVRDDLRGQNDAGTPASATVAGTVAYVSPEQASAADSVDHRADVYSLGATFYHAVTGELPFKGRSRMEIIYKQAREYPVLPHVVIPALDPIVSDVIAKMMAKDPSERYQTYDALLQALQAIGPNSEGSALAPKRSTLPLPVVFSVNPH